MGSPEQAERDRLLAGLDRVIDTVEGQAPADRSLLAAGQRPLVERLLGGAAPRESLLNLRRVAAAAGEALTWPDETAEPHLGALASVLSSGPELTRLLLRRPARLALLADPQLGRRWSAEALREALETQLPALGDEALDVAELAQRVAAFRNDQFVRLAACEFDRLASLEEVGRQISDVADACLQVAIERATARLAARHGAPLLADGDRPCGLAAIAMGKHGAQELNFCSDVDLVFVYEADEGQAGELSLNEFFAAVCREVIATMSSTTAEGFAFRIDMRLRPEGDTGPICNAIASAERYYETWGGPYDRLAWLKARAAAGDLALGEEMVAILRPFVYQRSSGGDEIVEQLLRLTRRIRAELAERKGLTPGWDVKLGAGGIRDVEFFVQALQLVHGGQQPALRERGTLRALDKLLFAGLISEQEHRPLAEAYELYRRVEHRLQLHGGRQTQLLPEAGPLRQHVVAHLGYVADPRAFDERLARFREQISAIHATLGEEPPLDPRLQALLEQSLQGEQALARVAQLEAFAQPDAALSQLRQLRDKPWGLLGRAPSEVARRVAPTLLTEICASPDPDAALRHMVTLSLRFGPFDGLWRMLDEDREAMRLLCSLFGTSDYLARMFIGHPELLDQLLGAGHARATLSPESLEAELRRRLDRPDQEDLGDRLATLRRFRNEQTLRIGLRDIAGDLALEQVWRQLTSLADVVLAALYPLVAAEIEARYGHPRHRDGSQATMVVLGLGKLGAQEMSYGSDLDLIFVYSGEGQTDDSGRGASVTNGELFARLAQRLVNALATDMAGGRLYEVDTRLRPSGAQGMLVVSRAAFCKHHRDEDEVWKRQVLLKARAVAGDRDDLGARLRLWLADYLFRPGQPIEPLAAEVRRMRRIVEGELAQEDSDFYNFKLGRGGLLDVEFTAQLLQLGHGHQATALRHRPTLEVLGAAGEAGLVGEGTLTALSAGYRFLRRLEGRLRIVRDRSADRLPASPRALDLVARRLGYRDQRDTGQRDIGAGEQLLTAYREHTGAIRAAYEEIVGQDEHR